MEANVKKYLLFPYFSFFSGCQTQTRLHCVDFTRIAALNTASDDERSFQSAAASTWNALPRSVSSSTSVLQFRSQLKTELFAR